MNKTRKSSQMLFAVCMYSVIFRFKSITKTGTYYDEFWEHLSSSKLC